MEDEVSRYVKNFMQTMPSEELYFEAVRDLMKDIIKEYIRKKINEDEELKKGIVEVLEEFIEARLKEYDSMAKMAKITAKIGVLTTPKNIKDEAVSDFMNVFKKELEEIIRRTF